MMKNYFWRYRRKTKSRMYLGNMRRRIVRKCQKVDKCHADFYKTRTKPVMLIGGGIHHGSLMDYRIIRRQVGNLSLTGFLQLGTQLCPSLLLPARGSGSEDNLVATTTLTHLKVSSGSNDSTSPIVRDKPLAQSSPNFLTIHSVRFL